jgi:hypothetical protein
LASASGVFGWQSFRDLEQFVSAVFVEGGAFIGVASGAGGLFQLAPQSVISDGVLFYALELSVDHRLHFSGPPLVGFGSRLEVGKRPTLFQVAAGFGAVKLRDNLFGFGVSGCSLHVLLLASGVQDILDDPGDEVMTEHSQRLPCSHGGRRVFGGQSNGLGERL